MMYLNKQFPQRYIKPHQIPRIRRYNLHMIPTHIFRRRAHSRFHSLPCRIHQQLRKPLKYFLYLLRIRLLQVLGRELYANIANASCDFSIRLVNCQSPKHTDGSVGTWRHTRRMKASLSFCCCLPRPPPPLLCPCDRNCWLIR